MMENIINFADLNPWTTGLTLLSLILFIVILFLINGKDIMIENAKLEKIGSNIFMLFMIAIIAVIMIVIAIEPRFATITHEHTIVYWVGILVFMGIVNYVTGIDPEEVFDELF